MGLLGCTGTATGTARDDPPCYGTNWMYIYFPVSAFLFPDKRRILTIPLSFSPTFVYYEREIVSLRS